MTYHSDSQGHVCSGRKPQMSLDTHEVHPTRRWEEVEVRESPSSDTWARSLAQEFREGMDRCVGLSNMGDSSITHRAMSI